jgi:glycosyltransferase involved in cell wall biosynthesis
MAEGQTASEPGYRVGDPAPPPLPRRCEAEVMARWQSDKPVVSIRCATYQHVGFIEDALRGFLGQNTDFPFEILVRDDASTDGTAEIVRDYADRYPNIIRAVLETNNRWPEVRASQVLKPMVKGDFVATCEGDDYWIDSTKLQKQFNLLHQDNAYVVSHHQVIEIKDDVIISNAVLSRRGARNHTAWDLRVGAPLPPQSLLYRNIEMLPKAEDAEFVNGDWHRKVSLGLHGGSIFLPGVVGAVYRHHSGGVWTGQTSRVRAFSAAQSSYWIAASLADAGDKSAAKVWLGRSSRYMQFSLMRSHRILAHQQFKDSTIIFLYSAIQGVARSPKDLLNLLKRLKSEIKLSVRSK